jgi:hypothetical protein
MKKTVLIPALLLVIAQASGQPKLTLSVAEPLSWLPLPSMPFP